MLEVAKSSSVGSFTFLQFHASLFGYMALKFNKNLKDTVRDIPPSLTKTVKRIVSTIIDLFFQESHDNIRNACSISFQEILDNCFPNKKSCNVIFTPIFEQIQGARDRASRQSACYVLRKLNEVYMEDSDVVSLQHCSNIIQIGIKSKVYDSDFLSAISDLIKAHGVTVVLGQDLIKAIQYFINSINGNVSGNNAFGTV